MPTDILEEHQQFIANDVRVLYQEASLTSLFAHEKLVRKWNYLSYHLLEHLIKEFELSIEAEMEAYKHDLQLFRIKTPLKLFCKTQTKRRLKPSDEFKEVVAEFKWPDDVTLEVVEHFRKEFAYHYNLRECALMLAVVLPCSFIVTWYIPESVVEKLKVNVPKEILEKYNTTKLEIDGECVYSLPQAQAPDPSNNADNEMITPLAAMTREFMELHHLTMEGTVGELESITNMDTQPLTDPSLPLLTAAPLPFIAPPLQLTTSPLQPIAFPLQPITSTSPPTTSPVETSAQVDRPPFLPLAQPSAPPHIPDQSSASQDKIAEVKATIQHFKQEFDDLFHCTQTYIENQDANFSSEFRSYLLVLPVSDWDHSVTLFNRDEITGTQKTSEMFVVIGNYCNYFHHDLLVVISMRFCEVPLKRRMLEYQKSFERFEEATDVHLYLQAVPVFPSLKFFDRCSVVLDNHLSTSHCKLSKLKELKYDLANVYSVRLYGLFIENIRGDPIVITFRIHPNVEVPPKPVIITLIFGCGI